MRYTLLACLFSLLLLACCGSNANPFDVVSTMGAGSNQTTQHANSTVTETGAPVAPEKPSDPTVKEWLVGAGEVATQAQINDASQFLQSLTSSGINPISRSDGLFLFWVVNMTTDQSVQASSHSTIASVELNLKVVDARVLPVGSSSPKKRNIHYETQELAVRELVSISQPSGVPDFLFKNYVYESNAGSKSYIYHVEYGVAYKTHPIEFPNVASAILTTKAQKEGRKHDDDNSESFHSTCTAGKLVGQQYGVAKEATLIPVIMAEGSLAELTAAFAEINLDLKRHPERVGFSVASLSLVSDGPGGRQAALLAQAIKDVMRMDVPVVAAAGNFGAQPGREEIDTYPALFAGKAFPLIVVGSASPQGVRSEFSQVGNELTLYAVGEDITCFEQDASQPTTDSQGTSFSAPIVAGQVANLLSYDEVPIDTSSGKLVGNMWDCLKNNPSAGLVRSEDIRMLWNNVTEADNARYKVCTGVGDNKYVARETLRSAIEDDFCNADLHSPLSRRYHEGSMEDVIITLDYYHEGPDPSVLTRDSCRQNLLELTDGCDIPDPAENPANFKAGGTASLGGAFYTIEPQTIRQPASWAERGSGQGCDVSYKFLWDSYTVWGHGWLSADFGVALREILKEKCSMDGKTWTFNYGLGNDGREWTAWFRCTVFQAACVSYFAKQVGANDEFRCH